EAELSAPDLTATEAVIEECVRVLKEMTVEYAAEVRSELTDGQSDERVIEEIIEDNLDSELRKDDRFHRVVDSLVEEIEKRFDMLRIGAFEKNRQGWPVSWRYETTERAAFVSAVTRLSSNYAPLFGTLLTPLVNGIRVAGPFAPAWQHDETVRLVVVDGEGLGH